MPNVFGLEELSLLLLTQKIQYHVSKTLTFSVLSNKIRTSLSSSEYNTLS